MKKTPFRVDKLVKMCFLQVDYSTAPGFLDWWFQASSNLHPHCRCFCVGHSLYNLTGLLSWRAKCSAVHPIFLKMILLENKIKQNKKSLLDKFSYSRGDTVKLRCKPKIRNLRLQVPLEIQCLCICASEFF